MSIEWPEEVVERVARAICVAEGDDPADPLVLADGKPVVLAWEPYADAAIAALDALGGERVWIDDQSRTQMWLHRRYERPSRQSAKVEPAILIKLEGE